MGNANGIFITNGTLRNIFRGNLVVGNPPIQVALDHAANRAYDIKNLAPADANTFDNNICLSGLGAPCPAVLPDAYSLLESQLQSAACGTLPPAASCQRSVNEWNWFLVNRVNPQAAVLDIGDGTQPMTVQQYVQARAAAGL